MVPDPIRPGDCLFLDVDGTLIDIAPNPVSVVVPGSLVRDLEALERQLGGALALVSGRTLADLDRLFQPLRLKGAGVHGAEFRLRSDAPDPEYLSKPLPSVTWRDLLDLLEHYPGTFAENKRFSYAVHYRAAPRFGPDLRRRLGSFITARPELGLVIMPGHCVFELKRPDINKGAAIARFLDSVPEFWGRRPVFLGDDVTDLPGFDVVAARGGLAYAVTTPVANVAGTFPGPVAVREWLTSGIEPETRP